MQGIVSRILHIIPLFPNITSLNITGDLKPYIPTVKLPTIRYLKLDSFIVCEALSRNTHAFLSSFPCLEELSVSVASSAPPEEFVLPVGLLEWPKLSRVAFANLWVSENEFLDFLHRHQVKSLSLRNITLTSGSWKSLFVQLRSNKLNFRGEGTFLNLYDVSFVLDIPSLRRIKLFLEGTILEWPFN
jgi:hypothetical protein